MTAPNDPHAALKAEWNPSWNWQWRPVGATQWNEAVPNMQPSWSRGLEYRRHPDDAALPAHTEIEQPNAHLTAPVQTRATTVRMPPDVLLRTHWNARVIPRDSVRAAIQIFCEFNDLTLVEAQQETRSQISPESALQELSVFSQLQAALERVAELEADAELGNVAMRFVDRAGDVHPGIDDAETICADFHNAMCVVLERQWAKRDALKEPKS